MQRRTCDILIVGGGGAALYAALRAIDANPQLDIVLACKGLVGKSGCTRMVQGGYNVVLDARDSFDMHYDDTLRGGGLINDQELAWKLVTQAPERIFELENAYGCYFDRNADGSIHQRALAGQSFDRTIHRGDLTGIELMSRLSEQILRRRVTILNEVRGVDLLLGRDGRTVCGAVLLDFHTGEPIPVGARAVLLASGGAAPLYRITAASAEKTGDGLAMAWRAGADLIDMEMMQFHPTGLCAGDSALTGTVLEEGLRGAGGHLLNAQHERFMQRYDPSKMERSTRDRVSRSGFMELRAGRGGPEGGVYLDVRHLGKDFILKNSPGMYYRCLALGWDMAHDLIPVTPTAHFQMGGVRIDTACRSTLPGLFAAGEDSGGVHGANRLGGNGVAESMVFGGVAGDALAAHMRDAARVEPDPEHERAIVDRIQSPGRGEADPFALHAELGELAWQHVGIIRSEQSLAAASAGIDAIEQRLREVGVGTQRAGNVRLQERLDVENLIAVARMIGHSAGLRTESRGSHYREDHPQTLDRFLVNIVVRRGAGGIEHEIRPVAFTRRTPAQLAGETVIPTSAKAAG